MFRDFALRDVLYGVVGQVSPSRIDDTKMGRNIDVNTHSQQIYLSHGVMLSFDLSHSFFPTPRFTDKFYHVSSLLLLRPHSQFHQSFQI